MGNVCFRKDSIAQRQASCNGPCQLFCCPEMCIRDRKDTVYTRDEKGNVKQITIDTVGEVPGYENARYTMTINATTVQATQAAVEEIFGSGTAEEDPGTDADSQTLDYLVKLADEAVFDHSAEVKTLKFDETNGTMTYVPYRDGNGNVEEGNWFMSFTDMVPGGVYKDLLNIENASNKEWNLSLIHIFGGSLAYFNQNLEAVNVLNVGKFDTEVVEIFNPDVYKRQAEKESTLTIGDGRINIGKLILQMRSAI